MIKRVAAIILALVLILIYVFYPFLLTVIATDDEPIFLGFNDSPRDISNFVSDLKSNDNYTVRTVVTTPSIFEANMVDPENTLYIATGIERQYTEDEITAVKEFIKQGGHAIIADDFGYVQPLADEFNITYYTGQFYDQSFDKSINFPICEATLGIDNGMWEYDENVDPNKAGQQKIWKGEKGDRDGVWDDDDDRDGQVDEDILDKIDNDQDNRNLKRDEWNNDYDAAVDETDEGIDEDPADDDGDWIDTNRDGVQDPYEIGVNEERLNGLNDDEEVYIFTYDQPVQAGPVTYDLKMEFKDLGIVLGDNAVVLPANDNGDLEIDDDNWKFLARPGDGETLIYKIDDMIDEDLFHYQLIMNKPVGLYSFKTETNIIARGSENSYVDLNNNGEIELPEEGSTKLADRVSTGANRVELIIEVVDPTFVGSGSVVFISDADLFTNDLYSLDHMSINYNSVTHSLFKESDVNPHPDDLGPGPDGKPGRAFTDDDGNGKMDDKSELGWPGTDDTGDADDLADNTNDTEPDYDNKIFMEDLIYYLFYDKYDSGDDVEIVILIDDSRHGEDAIWLRPMYGSLRVTSVLTSQLCYVLVSSIFLFLGLGLVILLSRGQEGWVHEFNVRTFKKRPVVPLGIALKKSRLKRAVLEKVRMDRGLSPEEFREVDPRDVDRLIGNPQLIQLVRDDKITYTPEDIGRLLEIINKWKK